MVHRGRIRMAGIVGFGLLVLLASGCANNMENAAKLMAERDPVRCSFTDRNGETQNWEGPICENIARAKLKNEAYSACAGMAAENEGMCVVAVALSAANSGDPNARTSDDVRLMIAAMNNDTQITSAWISQIPLVGTMTAQYFNHKANQDLHDTFQTAFENSGPSIGNMTVTKSDDGGPGGEAPGGAGGGGDQILLFGSGNQAIPGDGSVISDGRNAAIIAPGQNESVLDPSTVNNQSATGPDNPINNAPVVGTEDNDGSGDNSIIPGL